MRSHLAPNRQAAEDDLEAVEEVIADDDRRRPPGRPTLARRYRLYARRGHLQGRIETCDKSVILIITFLCARTG